MFYRLWERARRGEEMAAMAMTEVVLERVRSCPHTGKWVVVLLRDGYPIKALERVFDSEDEARGECARVGFDVVEVRG